MPDLTPQQRQALAKAQAAYRNEKNEAKAMALRVKVRQKLGVELGVPETQQPTTQTEAAVRGASQGIPFLPGFSDEIVGAAGAGVEALRQGNLSPDAVASDYRLLRDQERARHGQALEEHTPTYVGSEVGANLAGILATRGKSAAAPGRLGQMLQAPEKAGYLARAGYGAAQGIVPGAASAVGHGTAEDIPGMLEEGGMGGLLGAGFGAVAAPIMHGAANLGKSAWEKMVAAVPALGSLEKVGGGPTILGNMKIPKEIPAKMAAAERTATGVVEDAPYLEVLPKVQQKAQTIRDDTVEGIKKSSEAWYNALGDKKISLSVLHDEARKLMRGAQIGGQDAPLGTAGKMRGFADDLVDRSADDVADAVDDSVPTATPAAGEGRGMPDFSKQAADEINADSLEGLMERSAQRQKFPLQPHRAASTIGLPTSTPRGVGLAPAARLKVALASLKKGAASPDDAAAIDVAMGDIMNGMSKIQQKLEATPRELDSLIRSLRVAGKVASKQHQQGLVDNFDDLYKKALELRGQTMPQYHKQRLADEDQLEQLETMMESIGLSGNTSKVPTAGNGMNQMLNALKNFKESGGTQTTEWLNQLLSPEDIQKLHVARVMRHYSQLAGGGGQPQATVNTGGGGNLHLNMAPRSKLALASLRNETGRLPAPVVSGIQMSGAPEGVTEAVAEGAGAAASLPFELPGMLRDWMFSGLRGEE